MLMNLFDRTAWDREVVLAILEIKDEYKALGLPAEDFSTYMSQLGVTIEKEKITIDDKFVVMAKLKYQSRS